MSVSELYYDEPPLYDSWLKYLIGGVLGVTLVLAAVFFPSDAEAGYYLLGITALDALLFYIIIPRRLRIYGDRLRVQIGGPFAFTVGFDRLKEVRRASAMSTWASGGIRLATSTRTAVEIVRSRGLSMIITPRDPELFIDQLRQALDAYRSARGQA